MKRKPIARDKDQVSKYGAVMTPPAAVEQMLDMFPASYWTDPTYRWCEPAVGEGAFIHGIAMRLMRGLGPLESDPAIRWAFIFEHMVYACDIQASMIEHCVRRFGLAKLQHHFIVADFLTMDVENWTTKTNSHADVK